jgi:SAM-dependent methyltransferase
MDSQFEEVKVSHSAPLHRGCDFQLQSLKALANATAYNKWIFSIFVEYLGRRVLEIGCGTGNLTRLLLEKAEEVTAIDIHAAHLKLLATRVRVPDGHKLSIKNQNIEEDMTDVSGFDTVVLVNVLEHLSQPDEALRRIYQALDPGGRVVVLVPALAFLLSPFDELIGHCRRYTRKSLANQLTPAGFKLVKSVYFNFLGIGGWWWYFRILNKKRFTKESVALFETLVPMLRVIEWVLPPPVGLSVVAVGEK